jgi:hypothetical protein
MGVTYSESEGRRPIRATSYDAHLIAAIETTKLSSNLIY